MRFITKHRDRFGVEPVLRVLEVPVSTFYGWVAQQRGPSKRRRDDQALTNRIRRIHHRSGQTYRGTQDPRPAAPRRRQGQPQAGGAADARPWPAGRLRAQALALLHPPGPHRDPGAWPGRPQLHRLSTQPAVGGRPLADRILGKNARIKLTVTPRT
jgi:putative transposase